MLSLLLIATNKITDLSCFGVIIIVDRSLLVCLHAIVFLMFQISLMSLSDHRGLNLQMLRPSCCVAVRMLILIRSAVLINITVRLKL